MVQEAKILYNDLCDEFGEQSMLKWTGSWGYLAILDYMKDGTIGGFLKSLYTND